MKQDAPRGRLSASPLHLLHRAGQCAELLFASKVAEKDLTPRQFAVLATCATEDDLSQTDIVRITGIDRSTLADIVRRLVQRGYLQRKRTRTDARRYAVRLTESGKSVLAQSEVTANSVDAEIVEALSAHDRQAFLTMLQRVITDMEARVARPDDDLEPGLED
ncbi:MAG: MarR family transcriptional regulator [Hyphomicrobiaceae bacterium]|nr:MarR family transcriptional regulator [Hyphomicrobiaceae bacterium]